MRVLALRGHLDRAGAGETPRGHGDPKPTSQAESGAPEIAWLASLGVRRRRARQMYGYFIAQAEAEADFREWVITYADPTGETATDHVLWEQAKELTA